MKNLKRVLSLGLASVMLLGMMVVGASAKDFTDAEDIIHSEAVQTLVALNVIAGKEDGSYFDPKGDVTRGEMAKMITVIMQGGTEVNTGVKSTPSFTDIGGHWAEPYIEYCYDLQVISGRGDGTFDPNGKVTGLEAAKMVLTALGYDAEAYKLTGASWATRTDEVARKTQGKSLYESLGNVTMSQPASRDTAAQLIWNGLQAYVVDVQPGQNKNNGEVTWNFNTDGQITMLNQRYKAHVMLATFEGNHDYHNAGINPEKGEIGVTAKLDVNNGTVKMINKGSAFAFPFDMSIDNISEEVKVVWKNGEKSTNDGPDKNDTIFGVFNTGATRVVRSSLDKIGNQYSNKAQIVIDGTKYDVVDKDKNDNQLYVDVVVNYTDASIGNKSATNGNDNDTNSDLTKALKYNSGNKFKATFDDDGKINKIYLTQDYMATVTAVNSTSVTLSNGFGNLKFEDHNIAEDLEKGDVVVVTPLYGDGTVDDATITVAKAEKVSGEVTSYKDNENVVVSGTTYKINYKDTNTCTKSLFGASYKLLETIPGEDNVIKGFNEGTEKDTYIGEDVELYLVNGYVGAAVQTSESASNYSLVLEVKGDTDKAGATFGGLQLYVMGTDGTKEIITVSKDSSDKGTHDADANGITSADYYVGDIITYTFDDDDKAEVTVKGSVANDTKFAYNEKTKSVTVGAKSYPTSADCVLFAQTEAGSKGEWDKKVMENAEWEAYDIRALDYMSIDSTDVTVALNSDKDKAIAVFVNYKATPDGAADDTVYGVVSDYKGRVKDYYIYTVQSNGDEYTVNYKGTNANTLQKGDLVSFRPTANDNYSLTKVLSNGATDEDLKLDLEYGWVKEYNSTDDTLSFYIVAPEFDDDEKIYKGDKNHVETYALDDDVKIVYVDKDNNKSLAESSIDEFSAVNGTKNIGFQTKVVTDNEVESKVITVLFVETSGKVNVDKVGDKARE